MTCAVLLPYGMIAMGKLSQAMIHGARVVAYYFETTVKDAVARNRKREGKARVPDVALFVSAKKMVPPGVAEGFDEVRVIAPIPSPTS